MNPGIQPLDLDQEEEAATEAHLVNQIYSSKRKDQQEDLLFRSELVSDPASLTQEHSSNLPVDRWMDQALSSSFTKEHRVALATDIPPVNHGASSQEPLALLSFRIKESATEPACNSSRQRQAPLELVSLTLSNSRRRDHQEV